MIVLIAIGNRVASITTWMGLFRHTHKSMLDLVEPRAHTFVKSVHPQWNVVVLVVFNEGILYLMDIVKLVHKQRRWLDGVENCCCYLEEEGLLHALH